MFARWRKRNASLIRGLAVFGFAIAIAGRVQDVLGIAAFGLSTDWLSLIGTVLFVVAGYVILRDQGAILTRQQRVIENARSRADQKIRDLRQRVERNEATTAELRKQRDQLLVGQVARTQVDVKIIGTTGALDATVSESKTVAAGDAPKKRRRKAEPDQPGLWER